NDLRTALRAALLANLSASWFILPAGTYQWPGNPLGLSDGLRDNIRISGQNTKIQRDMQGVASNQIIFFLRVDNPTGIRFDGIIFELLNALTSFFSSAIIFTSAIRCAVWNCEFNATLAVGATQGRIRWGLSLLASVDCWVDNVELTLAQIQMGGQGTNPR